MGMVRDYSNQEIRTIACALPPLIQGSGGHRTILNNVNSLRRAFNCKVDIYIQPHPGANIEKMRRDIREFYGSSYDNIYCDSHIKKGYNIVIASMWSTVDMVLECDCMNKFYFVQDYEPWFYSIGNTRIQAEKTYSKGLNHIVFGRWLSNVVREKSKSAVWSVDYCADHDLYYPIEEVKKEKAICAIWQPEKPRRMHELLLEALKILEIAAPDLKVYLYGSEQPLPITLNNVELLGLLKVKDCNNLYNKCLCGVSLSVSNPSRIPFEMMTAGLPVVELYRDNNLYDLPGGGALLSVVEPAALAEAVLTLVNDPEKREKMHHAGIEYMKERLLENEAEAFVRGIEGFISGTEYNQNPFSKSYVNKPVDAAGVVSIIAQRIKKQKDAAEQEVIEPVHADSIRFIYDIPSDDKAFDRYSLAIWKEQDQSDLTWIKMRRTLGGRVECVWVVPEAASKGTGYNLHLYKKSEKMHLIGSWVRYLEKSTRDYTIVLTSKNNLSGNKYSKKELSQAIKLNNSNNSIEKDEVVLLDTEMDSHNVGDSIIMSACNTVCEELFANREIRRVSTHLYRDEIESLHNKIKILCGTNILYQKMENQLQWKLPNDVCSYNNVCLLGVGMNDEDLDKAASPYTRQLFNAILAPNVLHSVRDSITEKALKEMGIENVVNTGCPTMWGLTPEKVAELPSRKGKVVLTTVTDYNAVPEADKYMLETLKREYEDVYIFPQGSKDISLHLSKIINLNDYKWVNPTMQDLDKILSIKDLDYIGTRLHAGIRALNMGRRTLVIAVDNRAISIGNDTGFPVLERADISTNLQSWINSDVKYDITLPWQNIELWKNQWM